MERRAVAYLKTTDQLELPSGVTLVATIRDDEAGDRLAQALELIDAGEANTLFTLWLGDVARSFGGLIRLLRWLSEAGAHLVAQDVGLDTATAAGRKAIALLDEIDRWEGERRPRGRPGLSAAAPDLAERITAMREAGHSLHAIADALNRQGVPTPRGGSAWRASSVQSALGYRRPRPPAPGLGPKPPKGPKTPKPPKPHPHPEPHEEKP